MTTDATTSPRVHHYSVGAIARERLRRDFSNWRLALVRILTSALAVVITIALIPGLRFETWYLGFFTLMGIVFGLLNAFVKPLIQFFALRYLVASYGFVVVLVNALMLFLLAAIFQGAITSRSFLSILLGGLLIGVLGLAFETLAGATEPILDRRPEADEEQTA